MTLAGIVRRIDDLGRVVVPKEIRRTLRIREGDPLEIYTDREGGIVLRKYSPIGELGEVAKEYVESVASVAGCTVCATDRDMVVAAAGPEKKEYLGREIHTKLQQCIEDRRTVVAKRDEAKFCPITEDSHEVEEAVSPIISQGDAIGTIVLLSKNEDKSFSDFEEKMAICGSLFLGRQMEN